MKDYFHNTKREVQAARSAEECARGPLDPRALVLTKLNKFPKITRRQRIARGIVTLFVLGIGLKALSSIPGCISYDKLPMTRITPKNNIPVDELTSWYVDTNRFDRETRLTEFAFDNEFIGDMRNPVAISGETYRVRFQPYR